MRARKLRQSDIANAARSYLENGDLEVWRPIMEAVKDGRVVIEDRRTTTVFRLVDYPLNSAFGERLLKLQRSSGRRQIDIAEVLDVSNSSLIRQLQGQVLWKWPAVGYLIRELGGDPEDYREEYEAAKDERFPNAKRAR